MAKHPAGFQIGDRIKIKKTSFFSDKTGTITGFSEEGHAAHVTLDHGRKAVKIMIPNLAYLKPEDDKITKQTGITKEHETVKVYNWPKEFGPWEAGWD